MGCLGNKPLQTSNNFDWMLGKGVTNKNAAGGIGDILKNITPDELMDITKMIDKVSKGKQYQPQWLPTPKLVQQMIQKELMPRQRLAASVVPMSRNRNKKDKEYPS